MHLPAAGDTNQALGPAFGYGAADGLTRTVPPVQRGLFRPTMLGMMRLVRDCMKRPDHTIKAHKARADGSGANVDGQYFWRSAHRAHSEYVNE